MFKKTGDESFGNNIIQLINAISLAEKTIIPIISYNILHLTGDEIKIPTRTTPSSEMVPILYLSVISVVSKAS